MPPAALQEGSMQGGEQPGFYFRPVPQLMAFRRPNIKRLLRQIAGVCLSPRQAERELVKKLIVQGHYLCKIIRIHIARRLLRLVSKMTVALLPRDGRADNGTKELPVCLTALRVRQQAVNGTKEVVHPIGFSSKFGHVNTPD